MNIRNIFVLVLLIFFSEARSQSRLLIEEETKDRYHVFQYTSQQGLMQNTVIDLAFDDQNFLWLTTWKGISRFDGKKFKSFNEDRLNVRKRAVISFLNYGGKILMREKPHHYIKNGTIIRDSLNTDLNSIIFGENNQYLGYSNYRFFTPKLLKNKPQSFFYINDSCLYVVNKSEEQYSLQYFENGNIEQETLLNPSAKDKEGIQNYLKEGFVFKEQFYWWESKGVLKKYHKGVVKEVYEVPSFRNDSIKVYWKRNHKVFIYAAKEGELFQFTEENGIPYLKRIVSGFKPTGMGIKSITGDPLNEDILVGTEIQGLYRFRKEVFTLLTSTQYPRKNSTRDVINVGGKRILTNNGMLFSAKGNDKLSGLNITRRTRMFKAKNNAPWVLNPLSKLNQNSGFKSEVFSFGPSELNACVEDKDGRIWCEGNDGLYQYENNGFTLISDSIRGDGRMFYDHTMDEIWFASDKNDKVYRFKAGSTEFKEVSALSGKRIEQIFFASSGMMFIKISVHKFCVFKNNKLIELPGDGANYLSNAHCVLEDKNHNLWFSSDNGLFRTELRTVERYLEKPERNIFYYHYDKDWGFVNNEFNSWGCPCATTLEDGSFVFPSLQGVVVFNPLIVPEEKHGGSIKIEDVFIDGRDTNLTANPCLSQDFFELEFRTIHSFYDNHNNIYVDYKLEGYSNEWSRLPEDGGLKFSRLPFGNYQLVIRKLTGFGENDFIEIKYPFVVKKRYFQTIWFYGLIGAFMAFSVWLFFKWRISGIEKRREALKFQVQQKTKEYQHLNKELQLNVIELERITAFKEEGIKMRREMISIYAHDIRGPLHFIKLIAQKTSDHIKDMSEERMKDYLKTISESVQSVFNQTEKMFNWNRAQDDNLPVRFKEVNVEEIIEDELKPLISLAEEKNVKVSFKIDPEIDLFTEEDLLRIVINNLVQNSIKYTFNGSITIIVDQNDVETSLVFKDTGIGMDKEQLDRVNNGVYLSQEGTNNETGKAFGLRMVRDILGRLNASFTINSTLNIGTTIEVVFKHELAVSEEDIFLN